MKSIYVCDKCFEGFTTEYAIALMPGFHKCEVCGEPATHLVDVIDNEIEIPAERLEILK